MSGYHIREAGSNAVQEAAFTLAGWYSICKLAIQSRFKCR
ncbi:methylmalonyl-CoA mutase family protein [Paraclostridium bifermentans]|nr:methylmalonyl-CoA mutase family protein [Paraclostridium bifermentans]